MPKCGPDEPCQREDDANADQPHQERTRHPRLGIAAAQPLGDIGHAPILALLLAHRALRSADFVAASKQRHHCSLLSTAGALFPTLGSIPSRSCDRLAKREARARAMSGVAA